MDGKKNFIYLNSFIETIRTYRTIYSLSFLQNMKLASANS